MMKDSADTNVDVSEGAENNSAETDTIQAPADQGGTEDSGGNAGGIERTVEEELTYVREQLLRTAAELQNYRRRTEQVRVQESAMIRAAIVEPFLGILDDLERSLEATKSIEKSGDETAPPGGEAFENLRDGVALVHKKFMDELERLNITVIATVGEPFDEALHEALMQQPAGDDTASGTVLHEIQRGYRMGDRVIRHARVVVAQ